MGTDDRPEGYHDDQLLQGTYPPYDKVIHGPPGTDVGSLWIEVNRDERGWPTVASSWNLDDRQRAMVAAGAHVRLTVWGYPPPPVSVAVEGPFCDCHGEEMRYDQGDDQFVCHHVQTAGGHDAEDERDASRSAEEQLRRDFSPAPDDDDAEGGDLG